MALIEHCTITIGCSKSWGPTMTLWEIYKLATNAVHLCAARHPFRGAEAKIDNCTLRLSPRMLLCSCGLCACLFFSRAFLFGPPGVFFF